MTEQPGQRVERGAAEENAGAPLTETEAELSRRPPSEPAERRTSGDDSSGSETTRSGE
jgi:hypothetical protein